MLPLTSTTWWYYVLLKLLVVETWLMTLLLRQGWYHYCWDTDDGITVETRMMALLLRHGFKHLLLRHPDDDTNVEIPGWRCDNCRGGLTLISVTLLSSHHNIDTCDTDTHVMRKGDDTVETPWWWNYCRDTQLFQTQNKKILTNSFRRGFYIPNLLILINIQKAFFKVCILMW